MVEVELGLGDGLPVPDVEGDGDGLGLGDDDGDVEALPLGDDDGEFDGLGEMTGVEAAPGVLQFDGLAVLLGLLDAPPGILLAREVAVLGWLPPFCVVPLDGFSALFAFGEIASGTSIAT